MLRKAIYLVMSSCLLACTANVSETMTKDKANPSSAVTQESPSSEGTQSFVGQITGVDTLTAFRIEGNQVKAYTCGGDKTFETDTAWFGGEIGEDKKITLKSNDNRIIIGSFPGHKITAPPQAITAPPQAITAPPQGLLPNLGFLILEDDDSHSEDSVSSSFAGSGDMTFPDGKKVEWTVEKTKANSAGLYRFEDDEMVVGVIVHNDGRVFGAASSKETKKIIGQTKLVNPPGDKRCLEIEVNGKQVMVEPMGETGACK